MAIRWDDEQPAAGIEWDEPQAPRQKPTAAQAFGLGATQGATLGFGDEAQAAVEALAEKVPWANPLRVAAQVWEGRPLSELESSKKPLGQLYREARQGHRQELTAAQEAEPLAYGGGQLAGALVTAPVMPGGQARTLGQVVKQGALMGAVGGLGASEAETLPDMAKDVATGAAAGAGVGALGKGIGAAARKLGPGLKKFAIEQGRRVLGGGQAPMSLSRAVSDKAVEQAMKSGAMPAGANVGEVAAKLGQQRQDVGRRVGDVLRQLEQKGVQAPSTRSIGAELEKRAMDAVRKGDTKRAAYLRQTAEKVRRAEAAGPGGVPKKLGLVDMEDIKRTAQAEAKSDYEKWRAVTPLQKARKEAASVLQKGIERAVDQQKALAPQAAKRFVPLKQRFARVAEAEEQAAKGAIRAEKRNRLSLRDIGIGAGSAAGGGAAFGPLGLLAGPALALGSNLARTRGTSAIAQGALRSGEALQRFGKSGAGQALGGATDLLGRAAPGLAGMTPAQQRALALAEALRRREEGP